MPLRLAIFESTEGKGKQVVVTLTPSVAMGIGCIAVLAFTGGLYVAARRTHGRWLPFDEFVEWLLFIVRR